MSKPPQKRERKTKGGKRPPDAEIEARLRIVEDLLITGKGTSTREIVQGLADAGKPGIPDSTARRYLQEVNRRLTKSYDQQRKTRREMILRSLLGDLKTIDKQLKEKGVEPKWRDKLKGYELLDKFVGDIEPVDEGPDLPLEGSESVEHDELEEKDKGALDAALLELLERADGAVDPQIAERIREDIKETS